MASTGQLSDAVIIFDLDGTLVDSAPDLAAAMNHVLALEGHTALALAEVRGLVGNGAKAMLERGFAAHGRPDLAHEEMERHIDTFIEHYRAHIADTSTAFDGCEAMLDELKAAGAKLAVCTNKREELAHPLLELLGLHHHFDAIVCRDTLPVHKPAPEPLLACVERTGAARGIMVGDTVTDLDAAIAAEMPCLIATFGYGRFTSDQKEKAVQFDAFDALPGLVRNLL